MDNLVKFTKQYKASLIIAIAIIMFILFGFCSAVDVAGKTKVCGLKILFEGDGLGFSRFLSALILLAPMLVVLDESTNLKLTAKMSRIPASFFFGISIVLCLFFAHVLPSGFKLAWASWLYMLAGVIGIAVCNIEKLTNN
ncbi:MULTISPECIES: hypothetical protein [unclassified Prevotella]|uniref:hypothetical protein n=1 Tax=unclassified Prevotella TaxID=2638335 RepID=UPI000B963EAC|nr:MULTISPECIES: hypothetical protein [unclassified Prevotella]OYP66293.1 hypothetical protein CIK95_02650 [Prevotella sp. P5-108]OYP68238.1 hypothetical protein CIK87_08330 [Prevotella sp. P5-64]OYP70386.1 hypothetical protein CIK92_10115 [Prevotella sp. P4-67]